MNYDKIRKENKFGISFPYDFEEGLAYRKTIVGGGKRGLEFEEILEYQNNPYNINDPVIHTNYVNIRDIKSGKNIIEGAEL